MGEAGTGGMARKRGVLRHGSGVITHVGMPLLVTEETRMGTDND